MKKLVAIIICFSIILGSVTAQNGAPKNTPEEKSEQAPQSDDPFKAMQQMQGQMMQQLQKMFGGKGNSMEGDSTQSFGFQQFKLPFGDIDSTMSKAFGFSFDGNGFQSLFPENGDSTDTNGFQQMQEQFKKMMPDLDFGKLFQGQTPFDSDPSVVPPMDRQKPKSNKKYQTEKL
jgi:hypothetical protein